MGPGGILSTGPLGDLILRSDRGIANVTAPSIFGSILTDGAITGTILTTGLRTDPISGGDPIKASGLSGAIVSGGNLISTVVSDDGISGLISAQGNIGAAFTFPSGKTLRLGGILSEDTLRGTIVTHGAILGDVLVEGMRGGRVVADAGIMGNLTVDGGLDSGSAIIAGGEIGDAASNTFLTITGKNKGTITAAGPIRYGKSKPNDFDNDRRQSAVVSSTNPYQTWFDGFSDRIKNI